MIQAVKNCQLRVGAYRHLKSKSRERSGGNIVNAASKRILFSPRFVHSLRVSSLPSGHLQVLPGGRTMSAVSAQQSLHHRGRHALQLPQRLLSWRHGPTRRHVHQWVTPWHWKLTYAHTHTRLSHLSVIIRPHKLIETHLHIFVYYKHFSSWSHQTSNISSLDYRPISTLIYYFIFMPCICIESAATMLSLFWGLGSSK